MNNLYIFPQKIYLDSNDTIQRLKDIFVIDERALVKLNVGEWFEVASYKLRDKYVEDYKKMSQNVEDVGFNGVLLPNQGEKMHQKIEYVVRPMDTFKSVAGKLNISENLLREYAKTKHLYVGQKITIYFA